MKLVSLLLSLLMVSPAFAIRRVGFGGGDAENIVLRMSKNISIWSKACQQNKEFCDAPSLRTPAIAFEGTAISASFCDNGDVIIPNNLLYIDEKTPRNKYELTSILIQGIFTCQYPLDEFAGKVSLLPLGKILPDTSVMALTGKDTDVLVSGKGSQNLHLYFKEQTTCSKYRIEAIQEKMFSVRCLDKDWNFLVSADESSAETILHIRFQAME